MNQNYLDLVPFNQAFNQLVMDCSITHGERPAFSDPFSVMDCLRCINVPQFQHMYCLTNNGRLAGQFQPASCATEVQSAD